MDRARHDQALLDWIAAAGAQARRAASVCSGVFLLAAAGLATGRRVTTHWSRAEQLAGEHPELAVGCEPIFIRDGRVWTRRGGSTRLRGPVRSVHGDHRLDPDGLR